MSATHATDIGPICWRCLQTLWGYERTARIPAYWRPTCATCQAIDGLLWLPDPSPTIADLRRRHEEFAAHVRPTGLFWGVKGHARRFPSRDAACIWASRELGPGDWVVFEYPAV